MPFDTYQRVVDQLAALNYSGRIAYHVNNDPLLFRDLEKFIRYASTNVPKANIQVLTNGLALTSAKINMILDSGATELTINHYTDDDQILVLAGAKKTESSSQKLMDLLPSKYRKIEEQILSWGKVVHRGDRFNFTIRKGDHEFRYSLLPSRLTTIKTNRAGTAPNKVEVQTPEYGFCEYPFTQLNITTDGKVSKCCADLFFDEPMGNVNSTDLEDLWFGQTGGFSKVRAGLLEGDRGVRGQCSGCDFYGIKNVNGLFGRLLRGLNI